MMTLFIPPFLKFALAANTDEHPTQAGYLTSCILGRDHAGHSDRMVFTGGICFDTGGTGGFWTEKILL